MPTSRSSSEAPWAYPFFSSTRSDLMRRLRRDVTFGHSHQCQVDFDPTTLLCFRTLHPLLVPSLLSQALSGS